LASTRTEGLSVRVMTRTEGLSVRVLARTESLSARIMNRTESLSVRVIRMLPQPGGFFAIERACDSNRGYICKGNNDAA
jgi:hypothetical protein